MGGLEAGVTLVWVEDADLSRCTLVRCCHCTFACGSLVSLSAPVLALGATPCWLGSQRAEPVPPWEAPGSVLLSTPVLGMWSVTPGVSRGALIQPPSWPVSVHLGLRAACPHSAVLSTLGGTEVGLVSPRCSSRLPGLDSGSCSADPYPLPSHVDVFSPDFAASPTPPAFAQAACSSSGAFPFPPLACTSLTLATWFPESLTPSVYLSAKQGVGLTLHRRW